MRHLYTKAMLAPTCDEFVEKEDLVFYLLDDNLVVFDFWQMLCQCIELMIVRCKKRLSSLFGMIVEIGDDALCQSKSI